MSTTASRAVLIRMAGAGASPILGLLSAPLLARGLGVDGRGEVNAATMPILLFSSILTFGLPEAVTYFVARTPDTTPGVMRRALTWSLCVGLLGTALVLVSADALAGHHAEIATTVRVCSLTIAPTLLLGVMRGRASARHQWFRLTLDNVVGSGARLAVLVALAFTGHLTPLTASVTISASTLLGLVMYIESRRPKSCERPRAPSGFIGYGLRTWMGTVGGIVLLYIDQVLMTPLASTYELGLYAVAVSLTQVALIFNLTVASVTFAQEAASPDPFRIAQRSRVSTVITAGICLIAGGLSIALLPAIFGADFAGSIAPLLVLLFGVVIGNPGSVVAWGLVALGRPELRSIGIAVAAVINVVLVLILVPSYGAIGAAWATVAGNLVASSLALVFLSRLHRVPAREYVRFRLQDFRR